MVVREAPLIQARGVSVAFPGKGGPPRLAIYEVDLTIRQGEVVCLIGPSGCGKSTFLNVAAGLLPPTYGEILYAGTPIHGINGRVGYITQQDNLLPWRTVRKNVEIGLEIARLPRKNRADRVDRILELVGLSEAQGAYPSQLSGGMRSRTSLARTLVMEPATLLMDEPFAALDAQLRVRLQGELLAIKERTGVTIVFVTHDLDEAIAVADRVVVLSPGPASTIRRVYEVPFHHPRTMSELRSDPRYAELWSGLWRDLTPRGSET